MKKLILLLVVLLFSTVLVACNDSNDNNQNEENGKTSFLVGTWMEVSYYTEGSAPTFNEGVYFEFSENAAVYTNGSTQHNSSYTFTNGDTLNLPELNREYKVLVRSDNIIQLALSLEGPFTTLLKVNSKENTIDKSLVLRTWDVTLHGNSAPSQAEVVTFDNTGKLTLNSNELTYTWDETAPVFTIGGINLTVKVVFVSEDLLVFVQQHDGYVWELSAKK